MGGATILTAPDAKGRAGEAGSPLTPPGCDPWSPLTRLALALIVALGLGLRASWVVDYEQHHPQAERPTIDEESYDQWARSIAAGDWLGDEVFFQEPLYPYVLGAAYHVFGAHTSVGRWLNVALAGVFLVMTALIAAQLAGARAGLSAAAMGAVAKPLVHTTALLLKPGLFLALLSVLIWLLLQSRARPRRGVFLWTGIVCGLAALVRGNALLLLPLVVLAPLARRPVRGGHRGAAVDGDDGVPGLSRARQCVWTAFGVLAALGPVALRNGLVGGVYTPTTSGAGTNFHVGNHPTNLYGVATELEFVRGIPEHEADDWRREAERRVGRGLDPGEVSSYWLGETLRSFVAQPFVHAGIWLRKLRLALHHGEVADNHSLEWDRREVRGARGRVTVLDLPSGGWFPWGALGLVGACLALAPARFRAKTSSAIDWGAARECGIWGGLYLATLVATVIVGRMRLPLFAFALPLAPVALHAVLSAMRAGMVRDRALITVFCLAATLFALVPVRPSALVRADLEERTFNVAVQHVAHGEGERALERLAPLLGSHAQESHATRPALRVRTLAAEAHSVAARESLADGDEADAAAHLRAAEALLPPPLPSGVADPLGARARFHVEAVRGRCALAAGRVQEAAEALAIARAFDPEDRGLELDALRARAAVVAALLGANGESPIAALESLRAEAATFAQAVDLEAALRTSARVLWAELEWAVATHVEDALRERRAVNALKILQGTLGSLAEGDPARVAVHLAAARIQLGLGNRDAARGQLDALLRIRPNHELALQWRSTLD